MGYKGYNTVFSAVAWTLRSASFRAQVTTEGIAAIVQAEEGSQRLPALRVRDPGGPLALALHAHLPLASS